MTEQQAIDRLHASLPREAGFTISFHRGLHSRLNLESQRAHPVCLNITNEWVVTISDGSYVHSSAAPMLADAVEQSLASHGSREGGKPPKLAAPSSEKESKVAERKIG